MLRTSYKITSYNNMLDLLDKSGSTTLAARMRRLLAWAARSNKTSIHCEQKTRNVP